MGWLIRHRKRFNTVASMSVNQAAKDGRRAVVAILQQKSNVLVIQRSKLVLAPGKICFPGGMVEPGETLERALIREMQEELKLDIQPLKQVWQNHSPWGVELFWWQVIHHPAQTITCNPQEVAWARWISWQELRESTNLLATNIEFLQALDAGDILL